MGISFDKIDTFIRLGGGEFRHLVLFDYGLFNEICDKIEYLISENNGITDSINHSITRIKSVINKNKNKYCYNIFLEKGSYKDKANTAYL